MRETPHITHVPSAEELPEIGGAPQISTPVIQMQDLEHQPAPETRVNNKGVKISSRTEAQDDENALQALEQIERSLCGQLPG